MPQHNSMVPLRPSEVFSCAYPQQKKAPTEKSRLVVHLSTPVHYNIINHRDKGKGPASSKKDGKGIMIASAYTNFGVEILRAQKGVAKRSGKWQ